MKSVESDMDDVNWPRSSCAGVQRVLKAASTDDEYHRSMLMVCLLHR
jgi:hypothetical protein